MYAIRSYYEIEEKISKQQREFFLKEHVITSYSIHYTKLYELLLDLLELLAQEELPLLPADLLLDLLGDLRLQAGDLELLLEQDEDLVDALAHIEG